MIRNSLDFANWKERKPLAAALRAIYTAPSAEGAGAALEAFARGPWGGKFPTVVASWRRAWTHVIPFSRFPRRPPGHLHHQCARERARPLAKDPQNARPFPTDEAATKLIWLALRNITATWGKAANHWRLAMNQFAILYDDRFTTPKA